MGRETHLSEVLKPWVIGHLIFDPILRNRIIRNILQICVPEVQNRIMDCRRDAPDDRMLLSLNLEELVQKPPMMRM